MAQRVEIRIGLIGAGLKGQHHLRVLKDIIDSGLFADRAHIHIVAVADNDADRLQLVADQFGIPATYADGFDLITRADANCIYICTPTAFHKDLCLAAIAEGKDVYCEKPVAFTVDDIGDIIRARNELGGVLVQVGMEGRSLPVIPYLKQVVTANGDKLGRLMNINFRDTQLKPYTNDPSHPSTWRRERIFAGHGILFEHSVHDLDALLDVFGGVSRVYANVKYYAGYEQIEDSAAVLLELHSGATIAMTCVWNNIVLDERLVEIFFENAYIKLRYGDAGLETVFRLGGEEPQPLDQMAAMSAFIEDLNLPTMDPIPVDPCRYANIRWMDHLIRREPAYPSLEDARAVQFVIEAIYRSAETGEPVALQ
ncbi:MAG TPA: Gfo/Idh/MocA family oxidoreductase [Candidatus Lokiarchaeia archaeon]|nr:Gfo/Idh/MocA family oxidoreductase [Candidatus Lokiarchaeia archaeon]